MQDELRLQRLAGTAIALYNSAVSNLQPVSAVQVVLLTVAMLLVAHAKCMPNNKAIQATCSYISANMRSAFNQACLVVGCGIISSALC